MSKVDEFNFDAPVVDPDVQYPKDRDATPMLIWSGKQGDERSFGYWFARRDSFDAVPVGFQEKTIRLGGPAEPMIDVYVTQRLRFAPVAVRRRKTVTGPDGRIYHFPLFTKRVDMADAVGTEKFKAKQRTQVMGFTVDDMIPRMLALGGFSKGVFWDNEPRGQYGQSDWPLGVWQNLGLYAERATVALREKSPDTPVPLMPRLCAWWVDLIPWIDPTEGGPGIVKAGKGDKVTYMSPFVADMGVAKTLNLPNEQRFTGPMFEDYQAYRKDHGVAWELEWSEMEIETSGGSSPDQDNGDQAWQPGTPGATEDEQEIPF